MKTPPARFSLGIDITDTALNMVLLSGTPKNPRREKAEHVVLGEGFVVEGIVQKPEEVAALILRSVSMFLGEKDIELRVLVSVPDREVFPHLVHVASQGSMVQWKQEALRKAFAAIPFGQQELYADVADLGMAEDRQRMLFFVAARRRIVDALLKTVRHTGLVPHVFEMASVALARKLAPEALELEKEHTVVLDVGSAFIDVALFWGGGIRFAESFPLPKNGTGNPEMLIMLADHIERAMQFAAVPFTQLVVAGEAAGDPALRQTLENRFPNIRLSTGGERTTDALLAIAEGLALRGLEADPVSSGMNLLPSPVQKKNIIWEALVRFFRARYNKNI